MNAEQFKILKEGKNLKVGKNQIYFDDYLGDKDYFIVEKFEYKEKGKDMFSVVDGYHHFEDAYDIAKTV